MRNVFHLMLALGMVAAGPVSAQELAVPMLPLPTAAVMMPAPIPVLDWNAVCCCDALKCLPPGAHQIVVIHPYTCCPVTVCFCLPCVPCKCYEVECHKGLFCKKIVFDYPGLKHDVVVKFCKDGCVKVN